MTAEQLSTYCETLADIAYDCGHRRLRLSNNSRERIGTLVSWAREFDERHRETDWEEVDYMETIEAFVGAKLADRQAPLDTPCPVCGHRTLVSETIEGPGPYLSVVCTHCGRILEDDRAAWFFIDVRRRNPEEELTIPAAHAETIDVFLSPATIPNAFERKVRCLTSGGISREEAERTVRATPLTLEIFYDIGRGLFAVESEAVDNIEIFNPYTGLEIPKQEEE